MDLDKIRINGIPAIIWGKPSDKMIEGENSMDLDKIRINGIPAIIWGKPSDKMIIAAHGSHSSKIDDCIWALAEAATKKAIRY